MREKAETFQSTRFLIWTLILLNILLIVMPANAAPTEDIRKIIAEEARHTPVPTSLVMAVVKTESNFRPDHEGADGARGLMQILPGTAARLGLDPRSLWQARPNLQAGLTILEALLEQNDGHWQDTLLAYGAHRRPLQSAANQRYVTAVLKSERQFAEQYAALDALSGPSGSSGTAPFGHDDWGTASQQQMADSQPAFEPDSRDAPAGAQAAVDDVWGPEYPADTATAGGDVTIVIYEVQQIEPRWRPVPRVANRPLWRTGPFHPVRANQRGRQNQRQFAGGFGWQRPAERGRTFRQGGRW